ncbi:MAG: TIM barrel protein [Firmicutes bacterium]|nr:TIM barrel protein [Bacillota bacterium]
MFTLSAYGGWFPVDSYQRYYEAKKNGFSAMEELGWTHLDLDRVRAVIEETGVSQSALLFSSRDSEVRDSLNKGLVYSESHDAFVRALEETRDAALKIGTKIIVVTTGAERSDVSRYVQHTNIVTALRRADSVLAGSGIKIALEPLNVLVDHKGYYLVSTAETADIIGEVGDPKVTILYDIYHQQISEGNVISNIRNNIGIIGHIHCADVPGRKQPGTGELNYKNIFKAIADTGYDGYVTFECGNTVSVEQCCRDMLELVKF